MKIKIVKESEDSYLAKFVNEKWMYAQWSTPEEAVDFFLDVYKNILEIRKERENESFLMSQKAFSKVWDNEQDDLYAKLYN